MKMYKLLIILTVFYSAIQKLNTAGTCEENSFNVVGRIISKDTSYGVSQM